MGQLRQGRGALYSPAGGKSSLLNSHRNVSGFNHTEHPETCTQFFWASQKSDGQLILWPAILSVEDAGLLSGRPNPPELLSFFLVNHSGMFTAICLPSCTYTMSDGLLKGRERRKVAIVKKFVRNLNLSVKTTSPADTLALLGRMVADSVRAGLSPAAERMHKEGH